MVEFKAILSAEEALIAVERDGYTLQYVPDKLKTEAVVLKAVGHNGYALQYVPNELKTEAICVKAVESDSDALRYVPDELKTEAVVLAAVKRDGEVLRYVPDELKTEAVCATAVESATDALQYVFEKSLFIRLAEKFEIPIDIKDPTAKAAKAYAAYCAQAGGVTFDGKPLPTFCELGEERQACWIAAVDSI